MCGGGDGGFVTDTQIIYKRFSQKFGELVCLCLFVSVCQFVLCVVCLCVGGGVVTDIQSIYK